MKKKIISVILLSSLLLSGCSFNKNETEIKEERSKKYLVTLYTYQGNETYECKEYSTSYTKLNIITMDDKKLSLQGTYKIEVIK